MPTKPSRALKTFPNPKPGRPYEIAMVCPEFTCVCPMTGQPDFGTIRLRYVPSKSCVELKSLKLYLWSFRDEGTFHEAVTNRICDDLVQAIAPRWIEVVGDFAVRGPPRSPPSIPPRWSAPPSTASTGSTATSPPAGWGRSSALTTSRCARTWPSRCCARS
jgi:7-cyano-7-deazaguanine reductase